MEIIIDLPDISSEERFMIAKDLPYTKPADYFRSAVNVLQRKGYTFTFGFNCKVNGTIPINSGTSSSSALVVSWINFLTRMSDQKVELTAERIAELAYETEVVEFNETGGMMDQYSTAIGKTIFLDPEPNLIIERLNPKFGTFVLGDSFEEKNTQTILAKTKYRVYDVLKIIFEQNPNFTLQKAKIRDLQPILSLLNEADIELLRATLKNRNITLDALELLKNEIFDETKFGRLLNELHAILRDILQVSTQKIETMIAATLEAGAYGAKINGSGGGGCMFAYAPENPEKVADAIESVGGKSYIITIDEGTTTGEILPYVSEGSFL